jgi:hypothetical protein
MRPTIPQLLGIGTAYTPASGLTIPRAALIAGGLANPDTANAEQLFATIVINAHTFLQTQTADETLTVTSDLDSNDPSFRNGLNKKLDRYSVSMYSPSGIVTGADPDNLA